MPQEKKEGYVDQVAKYYQGILEKDASPDNNFCIPQKSKQTIQEIANLPQDLSPQQIETALQQMRDIQYKIVGDLSNELQVAVDGPKSANRPNRAILNACREIGCYQSVTWLAARDKNRNPQVYRTHSWLGEEAKINIALVNNGHRRAIPLVTLDGNALGVLARESDRELKERNLLSAKGLTLVARLSNTPSTTAQIIVKPETVLYPWQQRELEKQMEAKRGVYRQQYEAYASDILRNSSLT